MSQLSDEPGYSVALSMACTGYGEPVSIQVTLPLVTERQFILHEKQTAPGFQYIIDATDDNRIGVWKIANLQGNNQVVYSFLAQPEERKYTLPDVALIEDDYPESLQPCLAAESEIQSDDPLVQTKARQLAAGSRNVPEIIDRIYRYLRDEVQYRDFAGKTDAVTALKLQEASCNGKNRLFVALCRSLGIPARVAGGLILNAGSKRTTHSWTEVWIGGRWVPFCVVNDYYAMIPAHYLELYKGDRALITHTRGIGFDYRWKIWERLPTEDQVLRADADNEVNVLRTWARFKDVHISMNLLLIILTLPVGVTLITFCRNVIGVRTFGTFMPALMAVAFRDTGLLYGVLMFVIVVAIGQVAVWLLDRLNLLHISKMAVLLTIVVMTILALSTLALRTGHAQAAAVSLFPLAILTITAERFSMATMEDGLRPTILRFLMSLLVAALAYGLMAANLLRQILIAYPESLLYVIAINILLGLWTGLRLTEYFRFGALFREAR